MKLVDYLLTFVGVCLVALVFCMSTINYVRATLAYRVGDFTKGNFHFFNQVLGSILFMFGFPLLVSYTVGFSHNIKLFIFTWIGWSFISALLLQLQKRVVVLDIKNKFYALPIKVS